MVVSGGEYNIFLNNLYAPADNFLHSAYLYSVNKFLFKKKTIYMHGVYLFIVKNENNHYKIKLLYSLTTKDARVWKIQTFYNPYLLNTFVM